VNLKTDPGPLLFGLTRRRILAWLLGHPDQSFYLRQIARQVGTAVGATRRELELLTGAGLLTRTVDGRQVYFQANRVSPIFSELQSLFAKTVGLVDTIREGLTPLIDRIDVAIVFGSGARGELRASSDIDVLVVGTVPFNEIVGALAEAQSRLGRDINPAVYPTSEFTAKLNEGHHFLSRVLEEPHLFVIGGHDELVRLGATRLADPTHDKSERDSGPTTRRFR
jgi:predicted nucleotidyltransferase